MRECVCVCFMVWMCVCVCVLVLCVIAMLFWNQFNLHYLFPLQEVYELVLLDNWNPSIMECYYSRQSCVYLGGFDIHFCPFWY